MAESIEGLRWVVGRVSGWFGRDGGGIAAGDDGGETPAEGTTGAEKLRSWAYEDSLVPLLLKLMVLPGLALVGVAALDERWSSSASKRSSFSDGERGGERGERGSL